MGQLRWRGSILSLRFFVYTSTLILLLILPFLLSPFDLILLEYGLALALVGLGFNLLLRYTGLLSFGHGAYFATGAYTVAMVGRYIPELYSLEMLLPLSVLFSFIVSFVFGFICVRHTRIFFAILTLSLSMLVFALLFKLYHITGGSDGLYIPIPSVFGMVFNRRPDFLSGFFLLLSSVCVCSWLSFYEGCSEFPVRKSTSSDKGQ